MTFIAFIVAIVLLVGFHELGHFSAARLVGVQVLKFSIGFGKPIWKSKPKSPTHTQWIVSSIPLGGYVKMLDSREPDSSMSILDYSHAFDRQVLWKRSLIVVAGPIANFVLAWVLLTAIFVTYPKQLKPILAEPPAESLAYSLGVKEGDEIMSWSSDSDGCHLPSSEYQTALSWNQMRWKILKSAMHRDDLCLRLRSSDGSRREVVFLGARLSTLDPKIDMYTQLGIRPVQKEPLPWFYLDISITAAMGYALDRIWDISIISLWNIKDMLMGDASIKQIGGPLSIADMAGKSAQVGFHSYLSFLALISISLGILNLLPFPLLDGGQLMYDLWELATGRKVSMSFQLILQRIGVFGLLLLTLFAFANDLSRMLIR